MAGPSNPTKFTYDAPTTFVDGTAIPPGTAAKYQVGLGRVSGQYTLITDDATFEAGGLSTPVASAGSLALGQWYGAVRYVSKDGPVSAWSNEVAFTIDAKVPSAPTNFSVV